MNATLTSKEHATAVKRINETFYRMERCCESNADWDQYLDLNEREERGHRRHAPNTVLHGLTNAQAVRLFVVKQLFECYVGTESKSSTDKARRFFVPLAKDFFHIRGSIFGAWALWAVCHEKISTAFTVEEAVAYLAEIDYSELNKDPRETKVQVAA